ncbi:MAG: coproporphyrinogen dehydrogenase HemZ [Candidatus Reconcilbacillus cellulovorans]|uniref:Coproporphyrinogen dehydrogenase HemZ n=1 Tax=Candidatus Reconcilbacillus cellulovorans TaxID=1906605 RepID=A0A2A6E0B4_9BACL|nr:MAG: coproporphyrinogen dehydrogenase HemZ [Candidatus Reconcilbacillus cellulovorans]
MKVGVELRGFDDFRLDLFHLCRLFAEDAETVWDGAGADCDWRLVLELREQGDLVRVSGELVHLESGSVRRRSSERQLPPVEGERRRRARKLAVLALALQLWEDATGVLQPWGMLTGIRPTKLMHRLLREHPPEESVRQFCELYLASEEKARLLVDIAQRQLAVVPDLFRLEGEVSVYIGIPFCPTHCAYCTFPAYDIRGSAAVDGFVEALADEIAQIGSWLTSAGLAVTTVYWGGGTPTSLSAGQLDRLLSRMYETFPGMNRVRELTVEAGRPDTLSEEKLRVLLEWRVGRISINPQSFRQETLDVIGRRHTVEETVEKFELARRMGFDNINMDLIVGLPDEDVETFRRSLEKVAELRPDSLTVHALSFKRAAEMTKNREAYRTARRDEAAAMMDVAYGFAESEGYRPYYLYRQKNILGNQENVGFALSGKEGIYNIVMMEDCQTIVGLGCGAVSKFVYAADGDSGEPVIERFANPKEPNAYLRTYRDAVRKKIERLERRFVKIL